jgi:hypothetical protein
MNNQPVPRPNRKKDSINDSTKPNADLKCDFCERPKKECFILVTSATKGHICDNCIEQAHDILREELNKTEPEKDKSILKTARTVAGNREVIINAFDEQYSITTKRFNQTSKLEPVFETEQTISLTEPTLCLLSKQLNNAIIQFNINSESVIKNLVGDSDIYETFHDFTVKSKK